MKRIFSLPILICALSLCALAQTSDALERTATSSIKAARDKLIEYLLEPSSNADRAPQLKAIVMLFLND